MGVEREGLCEEATEGGGATDGVATSGEASERRESGTASTRFRNDCVREAGRVDCPETFPAMGGWVAHLPPTRAVAGPATAAADGALEAVHDHGRFFPRSAAAGPPT